LIVFSFNQQPLEILLLLFSLFSLFWQYWGLNSGLYARQVLWHLCHDLSPYFQYWKYNLNTLLYLTLCFYAFIWDNENNTLCGVSQSMERRKFSVSYFQCGAMITFWLCFVPGEFCFFKVSEVLNASGLWAAFLVVPNS
jgi:hypothetical protein